MSFLVYKTNATGLDTLLRLTGRCGKSIFTGFLSSGLIRMILEHNMNDYEETRKNFTWDVPEYYNFSFDEVDKHAKLNPYKTALISIDDAGKNIQRHSFLDLKELSNRFANGLLDMGVKKGDRAMILVHRIPEWYVAVLGMIKLGVIPIPTPNLSVPKDIRYRVKKSEACIIVTDGENYGKVDQVRDDLPSLTNFILVGGNKNDWTYYEGMMEAASPELDRDLLEKTKSSDPMMIYFTSGTTSLPKMVLHSHAYPIGHTVTARFVQDLRQEDTIWAIADNGWAKTTWGKLFGQWIVGTTVVQQNITGRFSAEKSLQILQDHNISVFCAPPTIYKMMINLDMDKYDLKSLRHTLSAGEPLNPDVIDKWESYTGLRIYDYYGQTECVALVANYPCMKVKAGSMGKPTPGHVVEVVDDEGDMLPIGGEGHIAVKVEPERPPGIFLGYWRDKEKTSEAFHGDWYYTGDKAYKDEDGYYWFVGRADDVIKASGYRIGPFEVESALQEHPAVMENAVIGAPDEIRGKIVKAYVILNKDYEPTEKLERKLQEHVKKVTAPYKYPRHIEFVEELPKTISGKIRRIELRDRAEKEFLKEHRQLPY
ncbi:MAG: AMP-binding protein [Thermoplasmata archaeon]